jgi:hypothetical protein
MAGKFPRCFLIIWLALANRFTSAPAPTPTKRPCEGREVLIQPGDTCDSFALAHNVSTYRLLIDNGLQSGCANFPTEGSLCVIGSCQTHNVTKSDTCQGLASKYAITITQFRTWNQVLNARCSNMDILVGYMACVSYPGNATSTDNPYATKPAGGTATTAAPAPTNVAPDVNTNCGKYYQVKGTLQGRSKIVITTLVSGHILIPRSRGRLLSGHSNNKQDCA